MDRGSCHEEQRRESPYSHQLLLLPTSSPWSARASASSEWLVQELLSPGADRKGKMEGSSCLPSLSQVWLLEKAAPRRGLLSPGERQRMGGGHDVADGWDSQDSFGERFWEELLGWGRRSPKARPR